MHDQIHILTLKCSACGAALEVSPDMERFACGYCGVEQIVQRRGGTVSLKLITDAISRVQTGTDRTAAELALVRLQKELSKLDSEPPPPPPLPLQGCAKAGNDIVLLLITIIAFFVGLWFKAADDYGSLAGVIVVWLIIGIPLLKQSSRESSRMNDAMTNHFKEYLAAVQTRREHILAQIAANKSIVEHSLNTEGKN